MAETLERVDLSIEGMTCAACATRVERRLNRIEGVAATVNYATATATVAYDPNRTAPDDLVKAVEAIGYHASLPNGVYEAQNDLLGLRLAVAIVLAVPVPLMSMVPSLQFDGWQWLSLALATPVVTWCGVHSAGDGPRALGAQLAARCGDAIPTARKARLRFLSVATPHRFLGLSAWETAIRSVPPGWLAGTLLTCVGADVDDEP